MTETVTLEKEVVNRLIDGASHLYLPAFPDDKERQEIGFAVNKAEECLERQ